MYPLEVALTTIFQLVARLDHRQSNTRSKLLLKQKKMMQKYDITQFKNMATEKANREAKVASMLSHESFQLMPYKYLVGRFQAIFHRGHLVGSCLD